MDCAFPRHLSARQSDKIALFTGARDGKIIILYYTLSEKYFTSSSYQRDLCRRPINRNQCLVLKCRALGAFQRLVRIMWNDKYRY